MSAVVKFPDGIALPFKAIRRGHETYSVVDAQGAWIATTGDMPHALLLAGAVNQITGKSPAPAGSNEARLIAVLERCRAALRANGAPNCEAMKESAALLADLGVAAKAKVSPHRPTTLVLDDFRKLLAELLDGDRDELYDALMAQLSMADLDELQARLP